MKQHVLSTIKYVLIIFMVISLTGCEAFVRKFTRKPKKDKYQKTELVLIPEVYQALQEPRDELYRQNFLYWKSWHDELISSLTDKAMMNHKKQLDCLKEAFKYLDEIKKLLPENKRVFLERQIKRLADLEALVKRDPYGIYITYNRLTAEQIKLNIIRDFSYEKIKGSFL
ncbi:MAG: hypothetical protein ABIG46_02150 [Candidatus Omnitrophota bacterium]|nr:hypothetical protein [Candidatus Omnitrophota bacterium]